MPSRSDHWAFTLHDYTEDDLLRLTDTGPDGTIRITTKCRITYLIFGYEVCPETGRRHLQGYLQTDKATEIQSLIAAFRPQYHWTKCRGSDEDNFLYCTKDDDFTQWGNRKSIAARAQGKRTDLDQVKKLVDEGKSYEEICQVCFDACAKYHKFIQERVSAHGQNKHILSLRAQLNDAVLRPWQAEVWEILSGPPDPRRVLWYWENQGNVGKSWMAKYLSVLRDALILEPGKKTDLSYIFSKNPTMIVIFDLNRTTAPEPGTTSSPMDVVYSLMESLKNGYLVSTKYESNTLHFPTPHVLVFANWEPDQSKMSSDRWFIKNI